MEIICGFRLHLHRFMSIGECVNSCFECTCKHNRLGAASWLGAALLATRELSELSRNSKGITRTDVIGSLPRGLPRPGDTQMYKSQPPGESTGSVPCRGHLCWLGRRLPRPCRALATIQKANNISMATGAVTPARGHGPHMILDDPVAPRRWASHAPARPDQWRQSWRRLPEVYGLLHSRRMSRWAIGPSRHLMNGGHRRRSAAVLHSVLKRPRAKQSVPLTPESPDHHFSKLARPRTPVGMRFRVPGFSGDGGAQTRQSLARRRELPADTFRSSCNPKRPDRAGRNP